MTATTEPTTTAGEPGEPSAYEQAAGLLETAAVEEAIAYHELEAEARAVAARMVDVQTRLTAIVDTLQSLGRPVPVEIGRPLGLWPCTIGDCHQIVKPGAGFSTHARKAHGLDKEQARHESIRFDEQRIQTRPTAADPDPELVAADPIPADDGFNCPEPSCGWWEATRAGVARHQRNTGHLKIAKAAAGG